MQKKIKIALLMSLFCLSNSLCASQPLVAFIQKPTSTQWVIPGFTNTVYYTLINNSPIDFPLNIQTSSPNASILSNGNTCGHHISSKSTCVLPIQFTAPNTSTSILSTLNIDFQGRASLKDTITYEINSNIACQLLNVESYQTPFCQQQYQQVVANSLAVFNTTNTNVLDGQSLGGIFAVYQRSNNIDNTCYISCGLDSLGGSMPNQNTVFELASITKTFTTSIFGKKIYQNIIDPNISVNTFLPAQTWPGNPYNLNPNEAPVTFQELATFSGGVCFSDAPGVNIHDTTPVKQSDFVNAINELDPTATNCPSNPPPPPPPPNSIPVYTTQLLPTINIYSNSSVGLLGQVIMSMDAYTQMDETDFNNWMCQHILVPLNMKNTNACLPSEAGSCPASPTTCDKTQWPVASYASGYQVSNAQYTLDPPFPFVPWAAAGNLRSNAQDMIIYLKANLGISNSVDPSIPDLLAGMTIAHTSNNYLPAPGNPRQNIGGQSPLFGGQGFAWVCQPYFPSSNAICGKIGGHPAFRSFIGFSPAKQYGVVILWNTGSLNDDGSGTTKKTNNIPSPSDIGVAMINNS